MELDQHPIKPEKPQETVEKKALGRPKTRKDEDKKAQLRKASAKFYAGHKVEKNAEHKANYIQKNGIDPNRVRIQCPHMKKDGSRCTRTTFNAYCAHHKPKRVVNNVV